MIELKIGRNTCYQITGKDRFMYDGKCVKLTTQSKQNPELGGLPHPVLSKKYG